MKTISEVFDDLYIPERLQMHMYRVAGVGKLVSQHFTPIGAVDINVLLRVLLIHDVGNVAKMTDLTTSEARRRDELVARYDAEDDHELSTLIAKDLGYSQSELDLLNEKIFINNQAIFDSTNYTLKIAAYADQRVTPEGVESVLGRLLEAKDRYKDRPGTSMNRPDTNKNIELAVAIEQQIFAHINDLQATQITDQAIAPLLPDLRQFRIV